MSLLIHASAVLGKQIQLGRGVSVGPYSVIEEGASIGDGTTIMNGVYIGRNVRIGNNNRIFTGAAIGHEAQNRDSAGIQGNVSIGDDNVFREYVTVNSGADAGSTTRIGSHNYFMGFSHVGHDSLVKDHVTIANAVLLAGHVTVEEHCFLGGGSGVHQYCRIGDWAMVGGHATVTKDVPPFMLMDDNEDFIGSLNIIGMRRAGFDEGTKRDIKRAYKLLYLSGFNTSQAVLEIRKVCDPKNVSGLLEFIKASKRGILGHRRNQ